MTWASLFERAALAAPSITVADVREELDEERAAVQEREGRGWGPEEGGEETARARGPIRDDDTQDRRPDEAGEPRGGSDQSRARASETRSGEGEGAGPADRPDPARVVADADVLAADLLVGGDARAAMDHVRAHRWVELVASDELLADGVAVVADLADDNLARDWRERLAAERIRVTQPAGDHPGLASAYAGRAAHLLTFDEGLSSSGANLSLRDHLRVSVRTPHAFATLFDPERLYPAVVGGEYPGPDADPRA